jgi:hypothetical protein
VSGVVDARDAAQRKRDAAVESSSASEEPPVPRPLSGNNRTPCRMILMP